MSAVADGTSLIAILRRKTSETWRQRDLRSWAIGDHQSPGMDTSSLMGALFRDAVGRMAALVGLPDPTDD